MSYLARSTRSKLRSTWMVMAILMTKTEQQLVSFMQSSLNSREWRSHWVQMTQDTFHVPKTNYEGSELQSSDCKQPRNHLWYLEKRQTKYMIDVYVNVVHLTLPHISCVGTCQSSTVSPVIMQMTEHLHQILVMNKKWTLKFKLFLFLWWLLVKYGGNVWSGS